MKYAPAAIWQLMTAKYPKQRLFNLTAKFEQTPGDITAPPPRLSAHTAEVLSSIGVTEAELADLKANNVI